jgi:anion transporter
LRIDSKEIGGGLMSTESLERKETVQVKQPEPKPSSSQFTQFHGLILAIVLAVLFFLLPTGLGQKPQMALAIAVFTVVLWCCNVLPIELTAILFSVLIAVFHILPVAKAFAGFSDVTPWFMVAVLMFGVAVTDTGLGIRLSVTLSRIFGTSFKGMIIALIFTGFVLTFLTPAGVERVLICYPLALGVAIAIMGSDVADSNVKKVALSVAYIAGNNFGFGILTGTSANMVALGVISRVAGYTFLWLQWAKWFFVPTVITTLVSIYIIYKIYPPERTQATSGHTSPHITAAELGPMTSRELKTLLYLCTALALWVTDRWHGIPPWAVAIFIAAFMCAPRIGCLTVPDLKKLPFPIALFSAGTISLGVVMSETGVSTWLGNATLGHVIKPGMSGSAMSAITFLVSAVLHFPLVESKAAIAGLVPVAAGYFHAMGMPVLGPTLLCTMSGLTIAFVPYMSLPAVMMIGFGPHMSYKHCAITVTVYSCVSIVVQLVSCFTWYRWTGLI